jgi:hypothetical protein
MDRSIDDWRTEICTNIKEVVLDTNQEFADLLIEVRERKDHANIRVGFIDSGISLKTRIVL